MNCVKCGREIPEDQVFCETCLTEMENYPVRPGTAVHIPTRSADDVPRKPVKKKRIPTAEELLLKTRKKLRRTRIFTVILLLVCGALSFLMAQAVLELDFQRLLGQNYRTEKEPSVTTPTAEWTLLPTETTEPTEPETELPAVAVELPAQEKPETAPEPAPAPTEAPTVPPTVAPTEAPTEPATQPPTEAPTEAPTQPPVAAPTEPPTEALPEVTEPQIPATEAPTEAAAEPAAAEEQPTEDSIVG